MRRSHYIEHNPMGIYEQWNVGNYPQILFRRNLFHCNTEITHPLELFSIGEVIWCHGVKRRQEQSNTASVEIIRSGVFSFIQDGRRCELKEGDVVLMEPAAIREMECLSPEASKLVIIFTGISIKHLIEVLGLEKVDIFQSGASPKLMSLYDEMYRLVLEHTYESLLQTSPLIYSILMELASQHVKNTVKRPEPLRAAIEHIFRNIKRQPDVQELCKVTGVSQMSLYNLFNEYLGMPPIQYLNKVRIEHAAELLAESNLSVKEVAAMLDYSSPQYFSALFKKHFGQTPKKHSSKN